MWVVAVALMVTVPFSAAVFLADGPAVALALFGIPVLLGNFYQATTFSQAQGLVGLRMRAVAAAILLFVLNIIGLGLGPYLVGLLSDALSERFGIESLHTPYGHRTRIDHEGIRRLTQFGAMRGLEVRDEGLLVVEGASVEITDVRR